MKRGFYGIAALLLMVTVIAGTASAAIDLRVESRPISDPIQAYVTVTNANGTPVGGLTAGSFTLTLDGTPLPIQPSDFSLPPSANPAKNVSIVFAMDYSWSTTGDPRTAMESAVVDFINSMNPGDYAAIVKFNKTNPAKASIVQPFTLIDGAAGTGMLVNAAMLPYPGSSTNVYDAINVALDHFVSPPAGVTLPPGPKAVVVISDGRDNASINTGDAVIAKASSLGIPLFTIAVGTPGSTGSNVMNALAARTGGNFISAPTLTEVTNAYVTISNRLDNGYLLSFLSSITDCNQHTLSVTVAGQGTTNCVHAVRRHDRPGDGAERGEPDAGGREHGHHRCRACSWHGNATVERHRACGPREQPEPDSRGGCSGRFSGKPGGVDGASAGTRDGTGTECAESDTGRRDHGDHNCRAGARYNLTIVQHHRARWQSDQPEPECRDGRAGRFGRGADSVDWPGSGAERGESDAGGGYHGDLLAGLAIGAITQRRRVPRCHRAA